MPIYCAEHRKPGALERFSTVLTRRQPYRHFSHERIAYKYLIRPGIGQDLTRIALDPKHPRKLATEAELLALRLELIHTE